MFDNALVDQQKLLTALKTNTHLAEVDFGQNGRDLDDSDAIAIADLLQNNTVVRSLGLRCWRGWWSQSSFRCVADAIEDHNHTILSITLNVNFKAEDMQPIQAQLSRNQTEKGLLSP